MIFHDLVMCVHVALPSPHNFWVTWQMRQLCMSLDSTQSLYSTQSRIIWIPPNHHVQDSEPGYDSRVSAAKCSDLSVQTCGAYQQAHAGPPQGLWACTCMLFVTAPC